MAGPGITRFSTGSSKTTGTTLDVGSTSQSFSVGDIVAVSFSALGTAGAVSVALQTATATVGTWTKQEDAFNGISARTTVFWAVVTGAGTITTVRVTHPSVTPRSGEIFRVTGADATTPVLVSNSTTATTGTVTIPAGTHPDCTAIASCGQQRSATDNTPAWTKGGTSTGWNSVVSGDSVYFGTTGGASGSNSCIASSEPTGTAPSSGTLTISPGTVSGLCVISMVVFQAPTGGGGGPTTHPAAQLINA